MVLHAFVTSRIDYCNGLLYGLLDCEISKLQRVQNAAARLLTSSRKYDHVMPVWHDLHWLPVKYRIHCKILLLTFKALNGMAPAYISKCKVRKYLFGNKTKESVTLFASRGQVMGSCRGLLLIVL